MKFSAMGTRDQAKLLCSIAPAVSRIGQDEEFNKKLSEMAKQKTEKGKTLFQTISAMVDAFVPLLLDRHYDDTMAIAGGLIGKDGEALEEMGIVSIVREVKGVIDEELIGFFKQSAATEQKA